MSLSRLPEGENNNQSGKLLFLIGTFFVFLGAFLPWECYGDFLYVCYYGIHLDFINLDHGYSDSIVMMVMISIGGSMILSGIMNIRQWLPEVIGVFVTSVVLYFSTKEGIVLSRTGGLVVIFLTCVSLWSVFRLARFSSRAYLLTTISTSSLILVLIFQISRILFYQIVQAETYSYSSFKIGLPVALVGAILMFAMRQNVTDSSRP